MGERLFGWVARVATAMALVVGTGLMVGTGPPASAQVTRPGSDFNGDGYQDIAIGAPGGLVDGLNNAGYVAVVYGSRSGLDLRTPQIVSQASEDVPDEPEAGDGFGGALAPGDFNADGFADLAVGAGELREGNFFFGSVTVLFGGPTGLGRGFVLPGDRGAGHAVGAGDINGDGQMELLTNGAAGSFNGTVDVYNFPRGGFDNPSISLGSEGWGGEDWIGAADVNGDGNDDVLAAWTALGGTQFVNYLPGSPSGIQGDALRTVDGGVHLAVGDLNRDGHADMVAGQPRTLSPLGGRIQVWFGTPIGLDAGHTQEIDQDTPGVPGTAEFGDEFGSAIAIGDVDADGYPDVAVGAQSKPVGAKTRAGQVVILRGGPTGLTTNGAQAFSQDTPKVPNMAETDDQMGWMVTLIDHDRNGHADLTATAIGEDKLFPEATYGNGAVTVLRGSDSGLTTAGAKTFGPSKLGADPTDALFGWSLTP